MRKVYLLEAKMKICIICGKPSFITLSSGEEESDYCLDCYNELLTNAYETNYDQFSPISFNFQDNEGILREFEISKMILPVIVKWIAEEVEGNYKFELMADLDDDDQYVISKLKEKIIKGVNSKSLETKTFNGCDMLFLNQKGVVNIEYDENTDDLPRFIIDGEVFTLEEFGRLLMTYEGYVLKYKIIEDSEDY